MEIYLSIKQTDFFRKNIILPVVFQLIKMKLKNTTPGFVVPGSVLDSNIVFKMILDVLIIIA